MSFILQPWQLYVVIIAGWLDRQQQEGIEYLRTAVRQFLKHYHGERNHQGLDNQLIDPREEVGLVQGKVECRERLGGLLRYYYRAAA